MTPEALERARDELIQSLPLGISHTETIDAILRKHFGPSELVVRGNGVNRFWVLRAVLGGHQYLRPSGKWTNDCLIAYFPTRAAAEAALAKAKEPASA